MGFLDAAGVAYLWEKIKKEQADTSPGLGELVYVKVTSCPSVSGSRILDCIVPAWVSTETSEEKRLRLLSPAILLRESSAALGFLYVSIMGGKYRFRSAVPEQTSGGNLVNVLYHYEGTGGGFHHKLLHADVLSEPDNYWKGSAAGDLKIYVGYTYSPCNGGTAIAQSLSGDCEILPDFNNVVI